MTHPRHTLQQSLVTANADATLQLGERLGRAAVAGDVVCLVGDLGSGKTTLTQGIGVGMGVAATEISSPTYALVAEHRGGRLPLYHLDVYRLKSPDDLHDLGVDDFLRESEGLIVIEWADIVMDALPIDHLTLTFSVPDDAADTRRIAIASHGPNSERLLRSL